MCKVMMIVGIKPNKRNLAETFIKKSVPFMSADDRDGLGYIAANGDSISGERWLKNSDAFQDRKLFTEDQGKLISIFKHAIAHSFVKYNKFGKGGLSKAKSILLHTRMATCTKSMENTHPFVIGDTALIHNGVISNSDEIMRKYKGISTCDSEAILQEYLDKQVNLNPENVQKMADELDGWYAVGVVSKDAKGRQIVDVFKCGGSSLYVAYVPALESFVFCTQIGILKKTAQACGLAVTAYDTVQHGVLIRFDAVTGERIALVDFVPEPKLVNRGLRALKKASSYSTRIDSFGMKNAAGAEDVSSGWDSVGGLDDYPKYDEDTRRRYADDFEDNMPDGFDPVEDYMRDKKIKL